MEVRNWEEKIATKQRLVATLAHETIRRPSPDEDIADTRNRNDNEELHAVLLSVEKSASG